MRNFRFNVDPEIRSTQFTTNYIFYEKHYRTRKQRIVSYHHVVEALTPYITDDGLLSGYAFKVTALDNRKFGKLSNRQIKELLGEFNEEDWCTEDNN